MSDLTDRANALVVSAGSTGAAQAIVTDKIAATTDAEQSEWLFIGWYLSAWEYEPR